MRPDCTYFLNGKKMTYNEFRDEISSNPELIKKYSLGSSNIPAQPFLKNWEELVLKRVLRMAAEEGYDKVSWINGEQTAARYDLSKQISRVTYQPEEQRLQAYGTGGNRVIDESGVVPEKIADYIGKEPAKKLLEQPFNENAGWVVEVKDHGEYGKGYAVKKPDGSYYEAQPGQGKWEGNNRGQAERLVQRYSGKTEQMIEGENLKIGGEWATNLYDRMIPKFLEKYGKKWGIKVENVRFKTNQIDGVKAFKRWAETEHPELKDVQGEWDNEGPVFEEYWSNRKKYETEGDKDSWENQSIAITPEMKESVLNEGQPLFQRGQNEPSRLPTQKGNEEVHKESGRDLSTPKAEVGKPKSQNVSAVMALEGAISKQLPQSLPKGSIRAVGVPKTEEHQVTDRIVSEALGKKPVWFRMNPEAKNQIDIGGAVMPKRPDEVFLNESTKKPVIVTAIHEGIHIMEKEHPDLYEELKRAMVEEGNENFAKHQKGMVEKGYRPGEALSESIAEISGERFTDPDFLQRLAARSPEAFRKLVELTREAIQKIQTWMKTSKIEHPGMYFRDLHRVDKALQEAIIEMRRRGVRVEPGEGGVRKQIQDKPSNRAVVEDLYRSGNSWKVRDEEKSQTKKRNTYSIKRRKK